MAGESQFEFIAGSPALCFVDSYGARGGDGHERLARPQDLAAWLAAAGLATGEPQVVTQAQLVQARELREAVHRCSLERIAARAFADDDVAIINRAAAHPPLRPQLTRDGMVQVADQPVEAALSTLAADALDLLASPLGMRIRRCPDCAMIFVDRSRPGRRRWCSSAQGCGNRAKVRNSRRRRAVGQGETAA